MVLQWKCKKELKECVGIYSIYIVYVNVYDILYNLRQSARKHQKQLTKKRKNICQVVLPAQLYSITISINLHIMGLDRTLLLRKKYHSQFSSFAFQIRRHLYRLLIIFYMGWVRKEETQTKSSQTSELRGDENTFPPHPQHLDTRKFPKIIADVSSCTPDPLYWDHCHHSAQTFLSCVGLVMLCYLSLYCVAIVQGILLIKQLILVHI